MKKRFLLVFTFLISFSAFSQEIGNNEGYLIERVDEEKTSYIEMPKINASLSFLSPEINKQQFILRSSDIFRKDEKREINMLAIMEKERRNREKYLVELESPMPSLAKGEKSIITISNQIQMHNRGSNFDIYTGEKKIPAYTEMRAGLFNGYYSPNVGGRYYSPYSSFLR